MNDEELYLELLNMVNDTFGKVHNEMRSRQMDYDLQKVFRAMELSNDSAACVKQAILDINYEKTAFGHFFIANGYQAGVTRIDVREAMTNYYYGNPIFDEMSHDERLENAKKDALDFLKLFEYEQRLRELLQDKTLVHFIDNQNANSHKKVGKHKTTFAVLPKYQNTITKEILERVIRLKFSNETNIKSRAKICVAAQQMADISYSIASNFGLNCSESYLAEIRRQMTKDSTDKREIETIINDIKKECQSRRYNHRS